MTLAPVLIMAIVRSLKSSGKDLAEQVQKWLNMPSKHRDGPCRDGTTAVPQVAESQLFLAAVDRVQEAPTVVELSPRGILISP